MNSVDEQRDRDFWVAVGTQLRTQRAKSSKSLRQVARELEVSPSYVSQVERGDKGISSMKIMRFCEVYEISLDRLTSTVNRAKQD